MATAKKQKIFELSGDDWMRGLSQQRWMPVGGIFNKASHFDPLKKIGIYESSNVSSRIGEGSLTSQMRFMVPFSDESDNTAVYIFGDGNSDNWHYNLASTVSQIVAGIQIGVGDNIRGATKFKDKMVYADNTTVYVNTIPVAAAEQSTILAGLETGFAHEMHIAPDRNLYITNKNHVARLTNVQTTTGNVAEYLTFEDDVIVRDLTDDGQYLIIIGDTHEGIYPANAGTHRCFVAFWNMKSQDLSQIWQLDDSFLIGAEVSEDEVIIFGRDNIHICSIGSKPRVLSKLDKTSEGTLHAPSCPAAIIRRGNGTILWGTDDLNNLISERGPRIYGYGRPTVFNNKQFFNITTLDGISESVRALYYNGTSSFALTDSQLHVLDGSSNAPQESTTIVAGIDFKQPHEFSFAKVIFRNSLQSGEQFGMKITSTDGEYTILDENTVSHASDGAVRSKIFYPKAPESGAAILFEDTYAIEMYNTGCEVLRVEIWGIPKAQDIDMDNPA